MTIKRVFDLLLQITCYVRIQVDNMTLSIIFRQYPYLYYISIIDIYIN